MFLHNKRIFLAGATGLVGASILKNILNKYPASEIRAVYHRHTEPFLKHKRLEYVRGDLRSERDCGRMARGCDCAIMAAASTANSLLARTSSWHLIDDNVIMNLRMLEAFQSAHIKRVLYIGSATLYQDHKGAIKEKDLDLNKDPHSSYFGIGWGSRFVEKICGYWHRQDNGQMIIVRASNVFGPYAKFDPGTSNFIPALIRKAVDRMDPFEVWGSPDIARDVIYSEDFAEAITKLLDEESITFDHFNVGFGEGTTVGDVVRSVLKCAGHKPKKIVYNPSGPATASFRVLDCGKIRRAVNWRPRYTIEKGIRGTLEWWIQNRKWWKK